VPYKLCPGPPLVLGELDEERASQMIKKVLEPAINLADKLWTRNALKNVLKGRSRDPNDFKKGRFNRSDIEALKTLVLKNVEPLLEDLPDHRDLGSRRMMRLAAATLATYQALLESGVERNYAVSLTSDLIWHSYEKQFAPAVFVAGLFIKNEQAKINWVMKTLTKYGTPKPGYQFTTPKIPGTFAINYTKCPVHDYFKQLGEEEMNLFRNSWCTLDYPLCEVLPSHNRGRYERKLTLSDGDDMCEMRWFAE
jgi:hypothetical protein